MASPKKGKAKSREPRRKITMEARPFQNHYAALLRSKTLARFFELPFPHYQMLCLALAEQMADGQSDTFVFAWDQIPLEHVALVRATLRDLHDLADEQWRELSTTFRRHHGDVQIYEHGALNRRLFASSCELEDDDAPWGRTVLVSSSHHTSLASSPLPRPPAKDDPAVALPSPPAEPPAGPGDGAAPRRLTLQPGDTSVAELARGPPAEPARPRRKKTKRKKRRAGDPPEPSPEPPASPPPPPPPPTHRETALAALAALETDPRVALLGSDAEASDSDDGAAPPSALTTAAPIAPSPPPPPRLLRPTPLSKVTVRPTQFVRLPPLAGPPVTPVTPTTPKAAGETRFWDALQMALLESTADDAEFAAYCARRDPGDVTGVRPSHAASRPQLC